MASAQVLRKQEHLEAGKRRLEEFRKKKAADRAKKVASISQLQSADVSLYVQPLENEQVRVMDSDGAGISDGVGEAVTKVINNDNKKIEIFQNSEPCSSDIDAKPPFSTKDYKAFSADSVQTQVNDQGFNRYDASGFLGLVGQLAKEKNDDGGIHAGAEGSAYEIVSDQSIAFPQAIRDTDSSSSQSNFHRMEETQQKDHKSSLKSFTVIDPGISQVPLANASSENSGNAILPNNYGYANMKSSADSVHPITTAKQSAFGVGQDVPGSVDFNVHMLSNKEDKKLSSSFGYLPSTHGASPLASESSSTSFAYDVRGSSNHLPLYSVTPETNARRSRPSFLDSINVPRVPSASHLPLTEPGKAEPFFSSSSKVNSMDVLGSSASTKSLAESENFEPFSKAGNSNGPSPFDHSINSSVSVGNRVEMLRHGLDQNSLERKFEFHSQKQNEDFAALEQHIEDLTQEKFSLQRALEASRALAESLAAENSSLTDSYNQQGSVVNQLKSDMEKLQEEIKAQLVDLESFKIEYANAQLECNAADERAKLLASEVIGLEEKALRLRSSELKLERQLENTNAEISSFKKKVSSLEKERQDLQLTIDALQEEKKLLQKKVRKASANGKSIDASKSPTDRKDVSTSTDDLVNEDNACMIPETSSLEMLNSASVQANELSSFPLLPEGGQMNFEVSSVNIPADQMRMIQNINALISELALEKEELMQALVTESSQSSKLKDLNKELSRKLEVQTQRLELLTSQSMANEVIQARQPDSRIMHDNAAYADEGDEVVERVLGWIMRLFPGGPAKRRTSKLL